MFRLENDVLYVELPEGKTLEELLDIAKNEFKELEPKLHGLDLKLNGRIPVVLALWLGHKTAHICRTVSVYSPMDKKYIKAVWH